MINESIIVSLMTTITLLSITNNKNAISRDAYLPTSAKSLTYDMFIYSAVPRGGS